MRRIFLMLAILLPLTGCGWFGFGHKDNDQSAAKTDPNLTSDEILKKDCSDENWKQQNLGLWYSVCRQPMKW